MSLTCETLQDLDTFIPAFDVETYFFTLKLDYEQSFKGLTKTDFTPIFEMTRIFSCNMKGFWFSGMSGKAMNPFETWLGIVWQLPEDNKVIDMHMGMCLLLLIHAF